MAENGRIFTKEEYIEYEQDFLGMNPRWWELKPIEIEDGKREEIQEKLTYLYRPLSFSSYGFQIVDFNQQFVKDPSKLLKLTPKPSQNDGIQDE